MAATNSPKPAASIAHTSTSMAAPSPGTRTSPGFGGVVASVWRRYSAAVVVLADSSAPRSVSWWLSGWPLRCAPTTANRSGRVASCASDGVGAAGRPPAGTGAPAPSNAGVDMRANVGASASSARSLAPGPTRVTPKGRPVARRPAGTASAASPSGLTNAVSCPSSTLGPTRSSSASAKVGTRATVGTTRASTRDHHAPAAASRCAQRASPALTSSDAVELARPLHDAEHGRVDVRTVGERELAERGVPLGEERAAVQQRAGVVHRRGVDLLDDTPARDEVRDDTLEARSGVVVAVPVDRRRDPDAGGRCRGTGAHPPHVVDRVGVGGGPREHRHAVERTHRRHHAVVRQHARRGLRAHDAAERGGDASGAGGVGAERERHLAGGDDDRRPGARTARDQRGIERIAARAVVRRPRADEPGGELVEVGLAREHRARGEQLLDHRGRPRRHVGELGTPGSRRHVGDVDVVLHRERHPGER